MKEFHKHHNNNFKINDINNKIVNRTILILLNNQKDWEWWKCNNYNKSVDI